MGKRTTSVLFFSISLQFVCAGPTVETERAMARQPTLIFKVGPSRSSELRLTKVEQRNRSDVRRIGDALKEA